ncbi:MAG: hypothetical protein QHH24_04160 [Candidatus Bathyarchaeota archaeon]|nr:hypothetical protein [Candidatus Bathyarchaeota archaeon]
MTKKKASEIISEAYSELEKLQPTPKEIQEYADTHENDYGVVTCSKSKGGDHCFLRFHDTWKQKIGGRIHIDVGYVDAEYIHQRNVPDTTHLMLDENYAPDFVNFIKQRRGIVR